jgi:uncharacterized damage-inducible protein DinB
MSRLNTINALFRHYDWAEEKMLAASGGLTREQLNQPFEIGIGTLRLTLQHIHGVENAWIERCFGHDSAAPPSPDDSATISTIRQFAGETAAKRKKFLASLAETDMDRSIKLTRNDQHWTLRLGDVFLHVCNHGMHHRAQATNMQRALGLKPPLTEYIFMQVESPVDPQPQFSAAMLRDYIAYSDWARDHVLSAAQKANDEQLDKPFDVGLGTIRKTLNHLNDLDRWWLENWSASSASVFPQPREGTKLKEIRAQSKKNAEDRRRFVEALKDADLNRPITAQPEPGRSLKFPLGQTMIEVCNNATHHRSHAINMLRRMGITTEPTDVSRMKRQAAA